MLMADHAWRMPLGVATLKYYAAATHEDYRIKTTIYNTLLEMVDSPPAERATTDHLMMAMLDLVQLMIQTNENHKGSVITSKLLKQVHSENIDVMTSGWRFRPDPAGSAGEYQELWAALQHLLNRGLPRWRIVDETCDYCGVGLDEILHTQWEWDKEFGDDGAGPAQQ